ncbi:MAG: class I SAM-dependent methyltransferase [Bacteroidota bacterium]|nr:class I SAM-dependent methyltransferase [Bacteroidota bacterium]
MNFLYYLKYFYFISINWNFRLAFFTVSHEIRGEKKYNIQSVELNRLKTLQINSENLIHSSIYQAANYYLIEKSFDYLRSINANKNIVDFGCGKGRVLAVAAYYGFTEITGIDFAKALCEVAQRNISKTKSLFPSTRFTVICDDAVNYQVRQDENVFFFFNPFDEIVMLPVVKNILKSLKEKSRIVHIVYLNPVHKEILLSAGFEEEYYFKKLEYLEISILSNKLEE